MDSSILCSLCKDAEFSFEIAHVNFNLRGEESAGDEAFCRTLASTYKVPFHLKSFDTRAYAEEKGLSIQQAARELRYDWFMQVAKEQDLQFILTAHHADDAIETTLHHFFRGTGLTGLKGIPQKRESIFRPLIHFRSKDLKEYAESKGLTWREDSSNREEKYVRNKLRLSIIPELNKIYPGFENNMLNNIQRFQSISRFYEEEINKLRKKLLIQQGQEFRIPVRLLLKYKDSPIPFELLSPFKFTEGEIVNILNLGKSQSGRFVASREWQAIRHRNMIILAKKSVEASAFIIEEQEKTISFPLGELNLESTQDKTFSDKNSDAMLDCKDIQFPLLLRKWKEGDYFYPLGLAKKKKVARFLIDLKIPKHLKEEVWVLESASRIIWVVGHRIDHRFRIQESTTEVLKIRITSGKNPKPL